VINQSTKQSMIYNVKAQHM